jgi:mannose-1-phosphate guanylyltransferase
MRQGCVWNSFVMIGRVSAFLDLIRQTLPALLTLLEEMWETSAPGEESAALDRLYSTTPATNFSDEVLAAKPSALAVLRTGTLEWSDLGEPQRVFSLVDFGRNAGTPIRNWERLPA